MPSCYSSLQTETFYDKNIAQRFQWLKNTAINVILIAYTFISTLEDSANVPLALYDIFLDKMEDKFAILKACIDIIEFPHGMSGK